MVWTEKKKWAKRWGKKVNHRPRGTDIQTDHSRGEKYQKKALKPPSICESGRKTFVNIYDAGRTA